MITIRPVECSLSYEDFYRLGLLGVLRGALEYYVFSNQRQ